MSSNRVIQDSDGSDDDLATCIDPLQDPNRIRADDAPQHTSIVAENMQVSHYNDGYTRAPASSDPNLAMNFDQFLVSQESRGQMSASQQLRESIWLGEGHGLDATSNIHSRADLYPTPSLSNTSPSPRKSCLKRGRTMCDPTGIGVDIDDGRTKELKRRKTMDAYELHQDSKDQQNVNWSSRRRESVSFDLPSDGNAVVPEVQIDIATSTYAEVYDAGTYPQSDEGAVYPQAASNTTTDPNISDDIDTTSTEIHFRKPSSKRSKSMQDPEPSPHDTEPFSSATYSQICRTKTTVVGDQPESPTHDELALPLSVQVAITQKKQPVKRKDSYVEHESDRDELGMDDYGGMPTECYKPRPSRSRSRNVVDEAASAGVAKVDRQDNSISVVVPQADYSEDLDEQKEMEPQKSNTKDIRESKEVMPNAESSETVAATEPAEPASRSVQVSQMLLVEPPDAVAEPAKKSRRGPKKKVKRGKTTSVVLKKVIDSDVEDDVIWLDERPAPTTITKTSANIEIPEHRNEQKAGAKKGKATPKAEQEAVEARPQTGPEAPVPPENQPPGPKKRGRKRKKTSDSLPPDVAQADSPSAATAAPNKDARDRTDTHHNSNHTVVPFAEHNQNPIPSITTEQQQQDETIKAIPPGTTNVFTSNDEASDPTPPVQNTSLPPTPHKLAPAEQAQPVSTNLATPEKPAPSTTFQKGPDKHSPIATNKTVRYRVGLSRSARIAPLLKVIRK
ncbi:hypothetical protein AJ80_04980 [Polytolypa hystricis UAMH7299]|uniref:Uncharacterized protein n=1 Tax=Polytolypa hystricis (strain UAMH7299) TaxID=1447883 RepID=A0A2B7Y798_POLH7|nr:hypothetical protein AJ80_04980 [Polytolypa hystricis UAMH7299]